MLDERSYKEAYPPERARAELIRCSGSQFDPTVVPAVLRAIDEVDAEVAEEAHAGVMSRATTDILPPL